MAMLTVEQLKSLRNSCSAIKLVFGADRIPIEYVFLGDMIDIIDDRDIKLAKALKAAGDRWIKPGEDWIRISLRAFKQVHATIKALEGE